MMTLRDALSWFANSATEPFDQDAYSMIMRAAESMLPKEPPIDTIRVRIAVAVDGDGSVSCYPVLENATNDEAIDCAIELLGTEPVVAQAIIEADVPRLPVVQGRVVEANP